MTVALDAASAADLATLQQQLGRPMRGVLGIAARCACGAPAVVATRPRLEDGTPFPTMYYLSLPSMVVAASKLEADGVMAEFQDRLDDPDVADRYRRAHESYIADREAIEVVDEIAGISAGGMPTRVKCLHALVGHALAAGPGVNPIGDLALERSGATLAVCRCEAPGVTASDAPAG